MSTHDFAKTSVSLKTTLGACNFANAAYLSSVGNTNALFRMDEIWLN